MEDCPQCFGKFSTGATRCRECVYSESCSFCSATDPMMNRPLGGQDYDAVKGVKRLWREVEPQITGYLVDLAEKEPEMAKTYMTAMQLYWQYRLENAKSGSSAGNR